MNEIIIEPGKEVTRLTIVNNNLPWTRNVLYGLLIVLCLLPIAGLYFSFSDPDADGRLPLAILFWVLSWLLFYRFVFWGIWGKEYIEVSSKGVEVIYDYKLVKSKPRLYEGDYVLLTFEDAEPVRKTHMVKLLFHVGSERYDSVLNIKKSDADQLNFRSDINLDVKPYQP